MNRLQRTRLIIVAAQFFLLPLFAETFPAAKSFSIQTNFPPMPKAQSPVSFFRNLLAMTPEQRDDFLTNKSPAVRERITVKVREYQTLDAGERELRLRATELRWYLLPLLRAPATNREAQLALVPEEIRGIIKSRLMQWEILPPPLQREFLENERALRYFSHVDATNNFSSGERHYQPSDADQARWNKFSENERQRIAAQFNQFFELTPMEKQKALGALSEAERLQMEATLQSFDKLPPPQRMQCVRAFTKFAGMSPQQRSEFLKNAERWSQMSSKDRQAWRDLVANVPQWPPLPQSMIMPPLPPKVQRSHPMVATNL